MNDMADMMRAMQLFNIVKVGIPGITQQQMVDFMMAQSAERQQWFKTASMMDLADWIVAEMREQNYPASSSSTNLNRQAEREAINEMFGGNAGRNAAIGQRMSDILLEGMHDESDKRSAQKKAQEILIQKQVEKDSKCKVCGEEMDSGIITCEHCGHTQWGWYGFFVIVPIILSIVLYGMILNQHIFWAVVVGIVDLVFLIILVFSIIDTIKIKISLRQKD
jgi:hypothetical protein